VTVYYLTECKNSMLWQSHDGVWMLTQPLKIFCFFSIFSSDALFPDYLVSISQSSLENTILWWAKLIQLSTTFYRTSRKESNFSLFYMKANKSQKNAHDIYIFFISYKFKPRSFFDVSSKSSITDNCHY
jgi:hypothetical protein